MADIMVIDGVEYAKYDDMYYVSQDGDVYSKYCNRLIKHSIDHDGYHRVDIHGSHVKVHRLVWAAWVEDPSGKQINHVTDDKDDNSLGNLYVGTQKENIADCVRNGHRYVAEGRIIVIDKDTNAVMIFSPVTEFIKYSGHSCTNGSVKRMTSRKWFQERFELLDYVSHK